MPFESFNHDHSLHAIVEESYIKDGPETGLSNDPKREFFWSETWSTVTSRRVTFQLNQFPRGKSYSGRFESVSDIELLLTMLDTVYVDTKVDRVVIAVPIKASFRPVFQIPMTHEDSGVVLVDQCKECQSTKALSDHSYS